MRSHHAHTISFAIGFTFLLLSIYQAFFLNYPHFYTSFALGTWLVLDFADYKINSYSILGYFFQHKNRVSFLIFLVVSTFFCFVVDYLWGVRVVGMWEWVHYEAVHFVRMYVIMNASFVLGMYELFRVVKTVLKSKLKISDVPVINFRFHPGKKAKFYKYSLVFGLLGLVAPIYVLVFKTHVFIEYAMLFPFLSIILVSDSITHLTGGNPVMDKLIHAKKLDFISLFLTSFIASSITELINLFGNEWRYVKMPFSNLAVFDIPVAVYIGWIPLVIGSIAIVNMVKHLGYLYNKNSKE